MNSPVHTFIWLIAIAVYFVPVIVAWTRHVHRGSVTVVNVFLGWTVLGWVAALVMACRPQRAVQRDSAASTSAP